MSTVSLPVHNPHSPAPLATPQSETTTINTYGGDQALYSDHMPYDNQMMYGTQHQRHREADVNDQGRPAAAFDAAASLAVPAQPFSTQGGMPGGNVNKRQRMA
jgi:hypothetical protein